MHKCGDYKVRNDLMIYELESIPVEVKTDMHKPFIVTSLYSPNQSRNSFAKVFHWPKFARSFSFLIYNVFMAKVWTLCQCHITLHVSTHLSKCCV